MFELKHSILTFLGNGMKEWLQNLLMLKFKYVQKILTLNIYFNYFGIFRHYKACKLPFLLLTLCVLCQRIMREENNNQYSLHIYIMPGAFLSALYILIHSILMTSNSIASIISPSIVSYRLGNRKQRVLFKVHCIWETNCPFHLRNLLQKTTSEENQIKHFLQKTWRVHMCFLILYF